MVADKRPDVISCGVTPKGEKAKAADVKDRIGSLKSRRDDSGYDKKHTKEVRSKKRLMWGKGGPTRSFIDGYSSHLI